MGIIDTGCKKGLHRVLLFSLFVRQLNFGLLRYVGECITVNASHIKFDDGTVQARCISTCTGEILLSAGLTLLIGSTVYVVVKRFARY